MDIKYMKRAICLLLLLCNGCIARFPMSWSMYDIVGAHYDKAYYVGDTTMPYYYRYPRFKQEVAFAEKRPFEICSKACTKDEKDETVSFYQDEAKTCYLFSYTRSDLIKLKKQKGVPGGSVSEEDKNDTNQFILLIMKDGLDVMSIADYKRLRSTLKSHPFDPTLCKPKPVEMN